MHGDDVVPLLLGHVEHHAVPQYSVARDDDVQLSKGVDGGLDRRLAPLHGGHGLVAGHGGPAGLGYLPDHLVRRCGVGAGPVDVYSRIDDDDLCSLGGHEQSDTPSDTPSGAGDDGYFILDQTRHGGSPPILPFP